ncbi:Virulence protein [Rhizobium sp. 57MFTsu3.2]|nr:Virulence protein [Rhizobium sp. 57MFTsu3.2]
MIDGDCRTFRILRPISNKTISEHFQNLYKSGELDEDSVVRKFRITAADGKEYDVKHYSLDAILAVGYKVNSKKATEFRRGRPPMQRGTKADVQAGIGYLEKSVKLDPGFARAWSELGIAYSLAGTVSYIDAWIASQSKAVQIAHEYSGTFVRTEPMMADGFAAMGFAEEQINGFFLAASTL